MHISAVVLTHNDAPILDRCLKSLTWCDEVIIVDDESIDGTVTLAKKMGAKTYMHPLNDDFAAQRNFGLTKAKNEWVLFVDSDEVVQTKLHQEITMKTQQCAMAQKCVGFYLRRKDYWGGRWLLHGETGNVKLLRLARKDVGRWVQPVHETWRVRGPVGELVHPLLHYPHQNVAQFLTEINHYSTLYARYLYTQGLREPAWYVVGKPAAKFLLNYVVRLGFLDGTAGIVVAIMMSFHSFLVRGKLWQLHNNSDQSDPLRRSEREASQ
ncbi:glycosyltransferase family 2 protein [Candidatus Gottesmanbacteria bacterium]|nr:glycosyltransferase family 2 protein [Candidatus Gottesmanbacteria bacterium]